MNREPHPRFWLVALAVATLGATAQAAEPADPLDWPFWRGPERNGISRETGLIESWSPPDANGENGENVVWKSEEFAGRSTPIVMGGKLFTLCRHLPGTTQEGEKVVCLDAATGKKIWENVFNVYLSDVPDTRIGWSSVVGDPATGNVFALGVCGYFQCINGKTGETIWSHSMSEEYGMLTTYGGRTNFPVVFEDLAIISGVMTGWGDYAIPAHRFVAFDKRNGTAVWLTSTKLRPEDTTYSTPILGNFNGQALLICCAGDGEVYALQPRTGKVIWHYDASIRGINMTPLVVDNTVYAGQSEENTLDKTKMGAMFAIDGNTTGEIAADKLLWNKIEMTIGKSAPLFVNDRLYTIADNAILFVQNPKNGDVISQMKLGTIMQGSAVYGDGKIYAGEATGRWYILKPTEEGVEKIHTLRLGEEILGSPIISHGKIYLPTNVNLYCLGKADAEPKAEPQPKPAKETPVAEDQTPAELQLVPVEVLMRSGQKQKFQARLYNGKGQYLKTVPAELELKGPGEAKDGTYLAPKEAEPAVVMVTAKSGELTANARIRVVPPLPWSFDFDNAQVPPTWIGAANRHKPGVVGDDKVLLKVTTIPKGTRSQSWMGQTDLHDYTVQADVRGATQDGKLPEIGITAQRYQMVLMGESQELWIRSWLAQLELRFAVKVPFEWKADTWYVMKLRAENQDGKAVLKGKVWVRGEDEPEAWTIEGTDETPNTVGSPGIFGKSSDAELYYDNIKVTPNEEATAAAK